MAIAIFFFFFTLANEAAVNTLELTFCFTYTYRNTWTCKMFLYQGVHFSIQKLCMFFSEVYCWIKSRYVF